MASKNASSVIEGNGATDGYKSPTGNATISGNSVNNTGAANTNGEGSDTSALQTGVATDRRVQMFVQTLHINRVDILQIILENVDVRVRCQRHVNDFLENGYNFDIAFTRPWSLARIMFVLGNHHVPHIDTEDGTPSHAIETCFQDIEAVRLSSHSEGNGPVDRSDLFKIYYGAFVYNLQDMDNIDAKHMELHRQFVRDLDTWAVYLCPAGRFVIAGDAESDSGYQGTVALIGLDEHVLSNIQR